MTPGQNLDEYRDNVSFRQQLASVFRPHGPHNVRMETGHTLLPVTSRRALGPGGVRGPQVIVSHRNDPDRSFALPLGDHPGQWMPNLMRHLNSREVMARMHDQMQGPVRRRVTSLSPVRHRSSALGLPPGLLLSGEPGSRRLTSPSGAVVFSEHGDCGWIALCPMGSWRQWRDLALLILDTPDPDA